MRAPRGDCLALGARSVFMGIFGNKMYSSCSVFSAGKWENNRHRFWFPIDLRYYTRLYRLTDSRYCLNGTVALIATSPACYFCFHLVTSDFYLPMTSLYNCAPNPSIFTGTWQVAID